MRILLYSRREAVFCRYRDKVVSRAPLTERRNLGNNLKKNILHNPRLTVRGSSDISLNFGHITDSNSEAGKTSVIRPHFSASTADNFLLNNNTSEALSGPIIRGNVSEEQPSGHSPSWVNGVCNQA